MQQGKIDILDGMDNMDFDRVTELLSLAYWSPGISKQEVIRGAANSALVVGAFDGETQVGYCRAISDKTRFAYISDVYVDEAYRGRGIARQMLCHMLAQPSLKDVYQWLLRTSDAQGLYEKLGFSAVSSPECWMQIRHERPRR